MAEVAPDSKGQEALMEAINKGHFTLRTMYDQLSNLQKLGPVSCFLRKVFDFFFFERKRKLIFFLSLSFFLKKPTDDAAPRDATGDGPIGHARPGTGQGLPAADEEVHDDDGLDDGQGKKEKKFFF